MNDWSEHADEDSTMRNRRNSDIKSEYDPNDVLTDESEFIEDSKDIEDLAVSDGSFDADDSESEKTLEFQLDNFVTSAGPYDR
ncbi:hypothetical protein SLS60_011925 [Paraconiothyrium brasiliense]|uniref:Uncharacterized protein n=1 Tax=Paraconiothyrium brasiliense TaxID=300254 RepID=A0ABR3QHB1_9PLEO